MTEEDAAVLKRLRVALETAYGTRLRKVLLFGSRARGDHRPDSDFDVAVFLDRVDSWSTESRRLREITFGTLEEPTAVLVSAKPFAEDALNERTLFMHEVRREGVLI